MMKLFLLPVFFLWISYSQEPSFIVGRWKSILDDQNPDAIYMTLIFYADHQAEMDYLGMVSKGTWHWESRLRGFQISFLEEGQIIKMNMAEAELRNDTLFFAGTSKAQDIENGESKSYIVRIR